MPATVRGMNAGTASQLIPGVRRTNGGRRGTLAVFHERRQVGRMGSAHQAKGVGAMEHGARSMRSLCCVTAAQRSRPNDQRSTLPVWRPFRLGHRGSHLGADGLARP
jgi:hypothetical protein